MHRWLPVFAGVLGTVAASSSRAEGQPKPATEPTRTANAAVLKELDFANRQDFEDAKRGFIAPLADKGVVKNAEGRVVYDPSGLAFPPDAPAPDTVNPSLWRQGQLNGITGLFKVVDGIYQVRGLDLSNITFIETNGGVIVMDPLISAETAQAAQALYAKHRPDRPLVAVIYTHSHADHFGGVRGIVREEDVKAGKVRIIAPKGFTEEAVSENVYAGNAMNRRAQYMYGEFLPPGAKGSVGTGLGIEGSTGSVTLLRPTDLISETGQKMTVDGLELEFLMAPGSEAPAEMHFYVPKYKALTTAENAVHSLHNFYTLRGAKTRDVAKWVGYLNETLDLWGPKAEVLFAPHHWPVWGNARVNDHIATYRDAFRYIHDQTLRLANLGFTMDEIGDMVELPPALARNWATRGYYGSVSHNARAVYNFYLGYFDAHPADLHRHPPVDRARRYVKAMGGANAVVTQARTAYKDGDYRWTAELLKHVVFADPSNKEAKELQADALEQLGYQAECATWRGFYLAGAQELRQGVEKTSVISTASPDVLSAMPVPMLLDYMALRLDGPRAAKTDLAINLDFSDTKERYALALHNGVLNHRKTFAAKPDLALSLTSADFGALTSGGTTLDKLVKSGKARVQGNAKSFGQLLALLDDFPPNFNIVTPNKPETRTTTAPASAVNPATP